MADDSEKKVPARFYRNKDGTEPVRDWLQARNREDRLVIGSDIVTVEYGWPVGMPTCKPLGGGLWEVRSKLPRNRISRVLFCFSEGSMVLLHAFIKKSTTTLQVDLDLARARQREVER